MDSQRSTIRLKNRPLELTDRLSYEPLELGHIDALAPVLRNPEVYQHIGGEPPSPEGFQLRLRRTINGPPPHESDETWISYVVRRRTDGAVLGRLQATVHDGIAEVAFLFDSEYWGQGYATEGLLWLHRLLFLRSDCVTLWACTVLANQRCQALLARCGYQLDAVHRPARLLIYDEGDLVFRGPDRA